MANPQKQKTEKLLVNIGNWIESFDGLYYGACDSGTNVGDLDVVSQSTQYVIECDPSEMTARGVVEGIKACMLFKLGHRDFSRTTFTVQGAAGNVGSKVVRMLVGLNAKKIKVSDTNPQGLNKLLRSYISGRVEFTPTDCIYDTFGDIFVPCALGGILDRKNLYLLKKSGYKIIAGSANDQAHDIAMLDYADKLDILCAPDFVINAGGVMDCARIILCKDNCWLELKIKQIYENLLKVFNNHTTTPYRYAERLALARL
jgi:glutamate dehydrogenase/leucine dehydrogenase